MVWVLMKCPGCATLRKWVLSAVEAMIGRLFLECFWCCDETDTDRLQSSMSRRETSASAFLDWSRSCVSFVVITMSWSHKASLCSPSVTLFWVSAHPSRAFVLFTSLCLSEEQNGSLGEDVTAEPESHDAPEQKETKPEGESLSSSGEWVFRPDTLRNARPWQNVLYILTTTFIYKVQGLKITGIFPSCDSQ